MERITQIINDWDPIGFFPMAPKDEYINEIKKRNWIKFKDETDILQVCIDLLDFLKIKDFDIIPKLEKQILFKKTGNDFNKIALWIAHCDETIKQQNVNEYNSYNLNIRGCFNGRENGNIS